MLRTDVVNQITGIVGDAYVKQEPNTLLDYGTDALGRGHPADLVVLPGSTQEIACVARVCHTARVPLTPRGAGTGYTGGAVPTSGGVVLGLDRLNRIKQIDKDNLLVVVEPFVVVGSLQRAVERVGLFYPPDPASLNRSVIGGNVAECAGGPHAFKYGTTKRYVLGLEVVLPTGETIRTGGKSVKNVVGYDLTQLFVGSEGTLGIVTEIILRLIPKPKFQRTLRAGFRDVDQAVAAVMSIVSAGIVPAAIEVIDAVCLDAVAERSCSGVNVSGIGALLMVEVDGTLISTNDEIEQVRELFEVAGGSDIHVAEDATERETIWQMRRDISLALREKAPLKINHDVVVPKGRIPELFCAVGRLKKMFNLDIACFGHIGDGNIHVNFLVDPTNDEVMIRAREAERHLFEAVVNLEGSISGEHGIGFTKAQYLGIELTHETIELMRRLKKVFDPNGILNPGKIFPPH